jgi:hypothetical protein
MRVFVSATKEDLDPDCRPAVCRAIKIGDAHAETMEDWNAEYRVKPVNLCREALEKYSTHFIGVFAHRLGWVPLEWTISITEAEFEWAWNARPPKQMAVYMPKPTTAFDEELRRRATQSAEEAKRQAEFRDRVRKRDCTVVPFEDCVDLGILVSNRVTLWRVGGVRGVARAATGAGMLHEPPPVHLLGRRKHEDAWKNAWELIVGDGFPELACFLLHGPCGAGHAELIKRFAMKAGDPAATQRISISIGPAWREKSAASLLALLGGELQPGWVPRDIADLAARLESLLTSREVILEVNNIQRFPRAATGVIEEFWRPLRAAFRGAPRRRCTVFLSMAGTLDAAPGAPLLYDPAAGDPATFDPCHVFVLPPLGDFTLIELKLWLKTLPSPPEDAAAVAQTLFDETRGEAAALLDKLQTEPLT